MEQIKRIPTKLTVYEYLITYEYETWKGHHRRTDKRTVKAINIEKAKQFFKEWSRKIRTAFNVQILDVVEITKNRQEIVL